MDCLGRYKKETQNRHSLYIITVNIYIIIPVHNSKSKLCTSIFRNKQIQNLNEKVAFPFCGALKWYSA